MLMGVVMAQQAGCRTYNPVVSGSTPGRGVAAVMTLGKLFICTSVTKQYILLPAGKVTAGLEESNDSLLPGLWLRSFAG